VAVLAAAKGHLRRALQCIWRSVTMSAGCGLRNLLMPLLLLPLLPLPPRLLGSR
jgi:hypothetical protein